MRGEEQERANIQATRLAGATARMMGAFQQGLLTLQRLRTGGTQRVIVQHVNVNEGGQAVVAGEVSQTAPTPAGGQVAAASAGTGAEMTREPHAPIGCERVRAANAAPRCGARRRDGGSCLGPAMANGRCCMHGGPSTGPRTPEGRERSRRSNWRHGHYSKEAKAARAEMRRTIGTAHIRSTILER